MITRHLGITDYSKTFAEMKKFTEQRNLATPDELWVTEHTPVFTQGQAGKSKHILNPSNIPIVQSDRGGQITYHAPGQIVLYTLIDIKRASIGVRQMVSLIENGIIATLAALDVKANADPKAPGVYVDGEKIASLGLRVRQGRVYHGLSLNVSMDMRPFEWINPCGLTQIKMTQISNLIPPVEQSTVEQYLLASIKQQFSVNCASLD